MKEWWGVQGPVNNQRGLNLKGTLVFWLFFSLVMLMGILKVQQFCWHLHVYIPVLEFLSYIMILSTIKKVTTLFLPPKRPYSWNLIHVNNSYCAKNGRVPRQPEIKENLEKELHFFQSEGKIWEFKKYASNQGIWLSQERKCGCMCKGRREAITIFSFNMFTATPFLCNSIKECLKLEIYISHNNYREI